MGTEMANETLLEIANRFHGAIQPLAYDCSGSLMDMFEDALLEVLNDMTEGARIKWQGFGIGYGLEGE